MRPDLNTEVMELYLPTYMSVKMLLTSAPNIENVTLIWWCCAIKSYGVTYNELTSDATYIIYAEYVLLYNSHVLSTRLFRLAHYVTDVWHKTRYR